jgi:hypothetical protein
VLTTRVALELGEPEADAAAEPHPRPHSTIVERGVSAASPPPLSTVVGVEDDADALADPADLAE